MSNFAAMLFSVLGLLSAVSKATSKIINGFRETKYAFLEGCVEFCICLGRNGLRERQVWRGLEGSAAKPSLIRTRRSTWKKFTAEHARALRFRRHSPRRTR